jgi:hypothetical protein
VINANNETNLAARAAQGGGRMLVVKAPPPALMTKDQAKRNKAAKAGVDLDMAD